MTAPALEALSLCSVRVGDEVFGFDTEQVYEVLGLRTIVPVPLAPAFVAGLIPYRGEVLAVLCLRSLLGLPPRGEPSNVVVLQDQHEGELFGLAVDSLGDVLTLDAADFAENPSTLDARRTTLFSGAYKVLDAPVIYLKPETFWPMRLMELLAREARSKA
jgi:purine-binding chemotaxis protein CheW